MGHVYIASDLQSNPCDIQCKNLPWGSKALRLFSVFVTTLLLWRRRQIFRQQLLRMDKHLLADIELDQNQALDELHKPFWRR